MTLTTIRDAVLGFLTLGGPVVAILLAVSVVSVAAILYKLWQFQAAGVGRRRGLENALAHWDNGDRAQAITLMTNSRSHIRHVMLEAAAADETSDRFAERAEARMETQMSGLESGFRLLDSIAQIAPLLGLFGTVLGMIEAFQKLQNAGASVDPSLLAGGIWVALLTTAVGLAVAMPTSLVLTWLETRLSRDRVFADKALQMMLCPTKPAAGLTYAKAV